MFYNPEIQRTSTISDLRRKLNASIPSRAEEVNGWYPLHDAPIPEHGEYDFVEPDEIKEIDGKYVQTYKIIPEEVNHAVERLKELVKTYLNAAVAEKDYDSIENACSYVNSTNEKFANEARIASDFRDAVWIKAYELINAVKNSEIPLANDVFKEQLPKIEWGDEDESLAEESASEEIASEETTVDEVVDETSSEETASTDETKSN